MEYDQFSNPDFQWEQRKIIGQGGFGKVFKVKNKKTGQMVAIKQMDMSKFDEDYKKQALLNEVFIQKQFCNSPWTVKYFDHFIGKKYTYIISELCDGDLKNQIQLKGGKIVQKQAADIFREIIQGFKLLTSKDYIHRDVKPQNILIKNKVHKISDFGFSRKADIHGGSKIKQVCGTPTYMAPQLLFSQEYTSKCDIWSLGILLYEMIFGFGPWPMRHPQAYKQSIVNIPVSFPYGTTIGKNTKDFIQRSLSVPEQQRISWKQLFEHPFILKKDTGPQLKTRQVDKNSQGILQRVQQSSRRKFINLRNLFEKKPETKHKMNKNQFHELMLNADPTITTYETQQIFKVADCNKKGIVDLSQFITIFCEVDYRPEQDIASRRIQQIVAMAKARGINMRQFFQGFDTNKSGTIDREQFCTFIRKIAPEISNLIIQQMWQRFDKDKSGQISAKQFITELTRGVPDQQSRIGANYERAKRNLSCMKQFFKINNITPETMLSKNDMNKSKTLTIEQFGPMIQKINYVISKEQIKEMFTLIDTNNNGELDMKQIISFLS